MSFRREKGTPLTAGESNAEILAGLSQCFGLVSKSSLGNPANPLSSALTPNKTSSPAFGMKIALGIEALSIWLLGAMAKGCGSAFLSLRNAARIELVPKSIQIVCMRSPQCAEFTSARVSTRKLPLVAAQRLSRDTAAARLMEALVHAAPAAVRTEKGKTSAGAQFPEFRAWHALLKPLFGIEPPDWKETAPIQGDLLQVERGGIDEREDESGDEVDGEDDDA